MIEQSSISKTLNWDSVYALNPLLGIRPDKGRTTVFIRDAVNFRRGFLNTERGILLALLDGKRTLKELVEIVTFLFDKTQEESRECVKTFLEKEIWPKDAGMPNLLVKKEELSQNSKIRRYDPSDFAKVGSKFSLDKKMISPIVLIWMLSPNCYTDCIYCYAHRRPIGKADLLSDSRIRELIREIEELRIPVITFTGGDPLTHEHTLDYMEMLLDIDVVIDVPTKTPLTKEQVSRIAKMGLKEIQISIDGPNAEICEFMIGVHGWFDRIVETIRMLVDAGIRVRTNSIFTSHNIQYAEETALMLYSLGSKDIKLTNYSRSLYHHSESFWVPKEEAEKLEKKIPDIQSRCPGANVIYGVEKDFGELSTQEKEEQWPPPGACTAFTDNLVICPDGNCVATEEMMQCQQYILGNLKDQSMQEIWDSERFNKVHHPPRVFFRGTACYDCEDFDQCHYEWGYCFRDALKAYGTPYAPAPSCPKAPRGLKLSGHI